jgi:Ca2+/Na+ antiporter
VVKTKDIGNLQHERLIHLMVTLFFGMVFMITMEMAIVFTNTLLMLIGMMLLVLLIPYVWHYYRLENEVQRRYQDKN